MRSSLLQRALDITDAPRAEKTPGANAAQEVSRALAFALALALALCSSPPTRLYSSPRAKTRRPLSTSLALLTTSSSSSSLPRPFRPRWILHEIMKHEDVTKVLDLEIGMLLLDMDGRFCPFPAFGAHTRHPPTTPSNIPSRPSAQTRSGTAGRPGQISGLHQRCQGAGGGPEPIFQDAGQDCGGRRDGQAAAGYEDAAQHATGDGAALADSRYDAVKGCFHVLSSLLKAWRFPSPMLTCVPHPH